MREKRLLVFLLVFLTLVFALIFFLLKREVNLEQKSENSSFYLMSFFNNKEEYEITFDKISHIPSEPVVAGIVPHHFLAKDLIASFFMGIDPKDVEHIYLVGPDHFGFLNPGDVKVVTSFLNWQTPYGKMFADEEGIRLLLKQKGVIEKDMVFLNEHSIYVLVPFARKVFPQANIIPLVLKNSNDYEFFYELGTRLSKDSAVLFVSSDFSHYVPVDHATSFDLKSIEKLKEMKYEAIEEINCDCRQCIALLFGFLANQQVRFDLLANKSSLDFGDTNPESVTSYVSGYFRPY